MHLICFETEVAQLARPAWSPCHRHSVAVFLLCHALQRVNQTSQPCVGILTSGADNVQDSLIMCVFEKLQNGD